MANPDFNATPPSARRPPQTKGVREAATICRLEPIEMPDAHTDPPADASRDRAQLAADWERVRTAVFAQLVAGIGSFHDAEDVLQEVAVSVAKSYGTYDPQRPFIAWALGIARNHMLMYFRKHHRDRLLFKDHLSELVGRHLESFSDEPQDQRREALHKCLKQLDPDRRRLVEMRYSSGLSVSDISERLGKSVAAVKGSLHRVRRAMEKCVTYRMTKEF